MMYIHIENQLKIKQKKDKYYMLMQKRDTHTLCYEEARNLEAVNRTWSRVSNCQQEAPEGIHALFSSPLIVSYLSLGLIVT
jgi:hypothetical protein